MVEKEKFEGLDFEEAKKAVVEPTPVIQKKKHIVVGIRGNRLILKDEKGNGSELEIGSLYKKTKIGDSVYL